MEYCSTKSSQLYSRCLSMKTNPTHMQTMATMKKKAMITMVMVTSIMVVMTKAGSLTNSTLTLTQPMSTTTRSGLQPPVPSLPSPSVASSGC